MDLKKKRKWPVRVSFVKKINIFDKEAEERNGEFKLKINQSINQSFILTHCVKELNKQKPKQPTNKLKQSIPNLNMTSWTNTIAVKEYVKKLPTLSPTVSLAILNIAL